MSAPTRAPQRNFGSDNVAGVAPRILAALAAANHGTAPSYGEDALTRRVGARLAEVFERDVAVFPVVTGTAANALALACLTPPYGAVYCHAEAHINLDECGAPEFYAGGAKLVALDGAHGRIAAADLAAVLAASGAGDVHRVQPAAVSITQASELGTVYAPGEVAAIAEVARRHGLKLHMDGSRFANALARLGRPPADLTWRAGVDVLSFGATKNGAMAAEAVVFFDPALAARFAFYRKRAGHLVSKMRFVSAQLDAYLADDLWLADARHANAMADRLSAGLARLGLAPLHPVEGNEVFVRPPAGLVEALAGEGFGVGRWDAAGTVRMVTAFATAAEDVDALLAACARRLGAGAPAAAQARG